LIGRRQTSVLILLTAGVAFLASCAQTAFTTATRGRHVILHSSLRHEKAGAVQQEADLTVEGICAYLGLTSPPMRVEIMLFDSEWARRRYLADVCPGMSGAGAACFETETGNFVVALSRRWRAAETMRYLRHEVTHFVLASQYEELPPWVDEGLATFFEHGAPYDRPHSMYLRSLKRQLRADSEVTLTQLVAVPAGERLEPEQYAQAWGLTHFLLTDFIAGPSLIRRYLEEVRADRDAIAQFRENFGCSPEEVAPSLREHLLEITD